MSQPVCGQPRMLSYLHVRSHPQEQPEVYTQRPNVCPSLAGHPEDYQIALLVKLNELAAVDGADTELSLDS